MLTPVPQMRRDPSLSATPASVAEPPGVTEESTAPFSKLDTLECSAIKQVPSKFKRDPDLSDPDTRTEYPEAALRLNTERIERTEHYMRLDSIALLAGAWDLHPDSPRHRPASPIEDLTFVDCSIFEGVAGVFTSPMHASEMLQASRIREAILFPPLAPDIEEYLCIIAKDDGKFVKVSSRPTASGGLVYMYFNLHLTRQMFQDDATVRSTGATRKIFCVTKVELDENGNITRELSPEKMCCCGTWPLGEVVKHGVSVVHRLRDCSGMAVDLWAQSPGLEG